MFHSPSPPQGFVFTPAFEEKGTVCLLIIDPQNDFMEGGSLAIPGANEDMSRLSKFIITNAVDINSICVTMDTHSLYHIGNSFAYNLKDGGGKVDDFTKHDPKLHTHKQQANCKDMDSHIESYGKTIGAQGKEHVLWPLHCQFGTTGHAINPELYAALKHWTECVGIEVRYILKGCDTKYENFSVFRSGVVEKKYYSNPSKEAYRFNNDLALHLAKFEQVYIAGEAKSHCVRDSVEDFVEWIKYNKKKIIVKILTDCMTNVPGFENLGILFDRFISFNCEMIEETLSTERVDE